MKTNLIILICLIAISCNQAPKTSVDQNNEVKVAGAMKNVMWKGELGGVINLDSISKKGTYGIGPESYLTGELLLLDGQTYVSRVVSETEMKVDKEEGLEAPFFVYGIQSNWKEVTLPSIVKNAKDIEQYIVTNSVGLREPFVFKLKGMVKLADIHIQNLPEGSEVSSPQEAHQGQINYLLKNEEVEIIGFFSTKHKGIFTHHDSYIHMHLITADRSKMGHLDKVEIINGKMTLFLPSN